MSQNPLNQGDGDGATVRTGLVAGLQALATMQSGATAPATTYPYMLWADTTAGVLKQRNAANSAWIDVGTIDQVGLGILDRITGTASFKQLNSTPALATIGQILGFISTLTPGAETGGLRFNSKIAGVLTTLLELDTLARLIGAAGELSWSNVGTGEGPDWDLVREGNRTNNDLLAGLRWKYRDGANNLDVGAKIVATLIDKTSTSEDVALDLFTQVAGALASRMQLRNGLIMAGAAGGDMGAGTINAAGLFVNGATISSKLAQVVRDTEAAFSTTTAIIPDDNTIPQQTEGTELMSVSITPINASSKIRIRGHVMATHGTAANPVNYALFQDATANAFFATMDAGSNSTWPNGHKFEVVIDAGSTSARTYKLRIGPGTAGTVGINGSTTARLFGGVSIALLEVEELLP
jgi:hypothetical protein